MLAQPRTMSRGFQLSRRASLTADCEQQDQPRRRLSSSGSVKKTAGAFVLQARSGHRCPGDTQSGLTTARRRALTQQGDQRDAGGGRAGESTGSPPEPGTIAGAVLRPDLASSRPSSARATRERNDDTHGWLRQEQRNTITREHPEVECRRAARELERGSPREPRKECVSTEDSRRIRQKNVSSCSLCDTWRSPRDQVRR